MSEEGKIALLLIAILACVFSAGFCSGKVRGIILERDRISNILVEQDLAYYHIDPKTGLNSFRFKKSDDFVFKNEMGRK